MCSWRNSRLLLYPIFSVAGWVCFFPYDLKLQKNGVTVLTNPIRLFLTVLLHAVFIAFTVFQMVDNFLHVEEFKTIAIQMQVLRRRFMQVDLIIYALNSGYWYILRPDFWQSIFHRLGQISSVLGHVKYSRMHAFLTYLEFSLLSVLYGGGIWLGGAAWETVRFTFFHTVFCSFVVLLMTGLLMVVRDQFAELNRRTLQTKRLKDCATVHMALIKLVQDICTLHRVVLLIYIVELFLFITTLIYDLFKSHTTNLTVSKVGLSSSVGLILPVFLVRQCSHILAIGHVASSIKLHSSEFVPLLSQVMRSQYYPCFDHKLKLYVTVDPAVQITAFGFFKISNHMLGTLLLTAATYFIALLQIVE